MRAGRSVRAHTPAAGQGWGIDPSRGGMRTYETMRQVMTVRLVDVAGTVLHTVELAPEPV